ncbi:hypothetical protein EBZ80_18305 [bacterium]|nr:hypothetical protein [Betaproteobacteria bacterium]NDE16880.1 hypothetical protein [bacterium]
MISRAELKSWLNALPENADVYIDDDGLSLACNTQNLDAYIEVGGKPDDEETTDGPETESLDSRAI